MHLQKKTKDQQGVVSRQDMCDVLQYRTNERKYRRTKSWTQNLTDSKMLTPVQRPNPSILLLVYFGVNVRLELQIDKAQGKDQRCLFVPSSARLAQHDRNGPIEMRQARGKNQANKKKYSQ
jgi:hypothetical protein